MPSSRIATPEALDAATATAVRARREKLLRIAEGKGARTLRIAYMFIALAAICAVAALLVGDREAATIIGMQTCLAFGIVFISNQAARRKAIREVEEMDASRS